MAEVSQIFMFHTGRARIRRTFLEVGGGREPCWLPVLCFLLIHPDGPVLVDTGFGRRAVEQARRWYGRLFWGLLRGGLSAGMDCRSRIAECGVDPDAVRTGVLTHLHWDHTGGVADLPAARFRVSRRELDAARSVTGVKALPQGYSPRDVEPDRFDPFDFGAAEDLDPFDAAYDVLGDGSIRLIPTPGHSAGHASVFVQARGGREFLLVGDAAFTQGHILAERDLGLMPRRFAHDLPTARDTLHQLRALARRRPDLRIYTMHDPEQGDDAADGPVKLLDE